MAPDRPGFQHACVTNGASKACGGYPIPCFGYPAGVHYPRDQEGAARSQAVRNGGGLRSRKMATAAMRQATPAAYSAGLYDCITVRVSPAP